MMNRVYSTAGIVIVIGVLVMASGQAVYATTSSDFWDSYYSGEVLELGKKLDMYLVVTNVGLMIIGLGLAIMAFGLASQRPSQLQFREVSSNIPLEQYPQPPQSPP